MERRGEDEEKRGEGEEKRGEQASAQKVISSRHSPYNVTQHSVTPLLNLKFPLSILNSQHRKTFLSSSMAEHSAVNRVVVGSSPTWGATQHP